jgi:VIT1/CCC1 family predicted Fe2+/Mn2+ transporter
MHLLPRRAKRILKILKVNVVTKIIVYKNYQAKIKNSNEKQILNNVININAQQQKILSSLRKNQVKPKRLALLFNKIFTYILGYKFMLKVEERQNIKLLKLINKLQVSNDQINELATLQEQKHIAIEKIIAKKQKTYLGSMVLGLNDALVELTGVLVGLTIALSDTKLISLSALITGISASLSMASSEFLRAKIEEDINAYKSATYTGITYMIVVLLLVLPYLLISQAKYISLLITLIFVVLILISYSYYSAVMQRKNFKTKLILMLSISLGVATISFVIAYTIKVVLGISS